MISISIVYGKFCTKVVVGTSASGTSVAAFSSGFGFSVVGSSEAETSNALAYDDATFDVATSEV
ncbi:hypothetical protein DEO72_LG3g2400 [Vigna unguiculata]|uniref:Uncharacterized protein n=1 Tax=Vigna unguiculata TaxID=3917 RepID=A0A4D6LH80_VIGUN|nr:hypothetical protein DEO72_LG3g2400 [Vigna unguiculata]